ncbi:hypothetical protein TYRP_005292 [Tyrophagus putrescentiae]|nr:hypothetical protein TYRP_005292 [Tyrophagus putrescentiae]
MRGALGGNGGGGGGGGQRLIFVTSMELIVPSTDKKNSSPSVYSQWSTEPSRADCAAGEAQIVAPATPANQPPS